MVTKAPEAEHHQSVLDDFDPTDPEFPLLVEEEQKLLRFLRQNGTVVEIPSSDIEELLEHVSSLIPDPETGYYVVYTDAQNGRVKAAEIHPTPDESNPARPLLLRASLMWTRHLGIIHNIYTLPKSLSLPV